MKYEFPNSIISDYDGYQIFLDLTEKTNSLLLTDIILDFRQTTWFEANLVAILGAILNKISIEGPNNIRIINLSDKIKSIFAKNHFLSHFGAEKILDFNETTIKYRKFKITEEKIFKEYLDNDLLSKKDMPNMSVFLRKKINESIFEIFNNAVIHGNCKNIFSCGQYYPIKKKLDFTIVDLGRTIRTNVNEYLSDNKSGKECIEWAIKEKNTTKRGTIPGGLGLSLIREFLNKNNGKMQIVSSDGYWEQKGQEMNSKDFNTNFPGTIVNLEFNIDDHSYYCCSSEINDSEIF